MRYESESDHDLVAGVSPRFRLIGRFYSKFSLALKGISLSFDWSL